MNSDLGFVLILNLLIVTLSAMSIGCLLNMLIYIRVRELLGNVAPWSNPFVWRLAEFSYWYRCKYEPGWFVIRGLLMMVYTPMVLYNVIETCIRVVLNWLFPGKGWLSQKIHIPLIKLRFPKLIASDICDVQPMTAPTGVTFVLKNRYEPNQRMK
jgi:hypothetical protein